MKNVIVGTVMVFVAWMGLDFLFHGHLLSESYQATASLWRPMEEMKAGLNMIVVLIAALMFTLIYVSLIAEKSLAKGLIYGLLYGVAIGVGMGFGTYSYMPIPYDLALSWFGIQVVEAVIAGGFLGLFIGHRPLVKTMHFSARL